MSHRIYMVGAAVDVDAFNSFSDGDRAMLAGYVPPGLLPTGQTTFTQTNKPEPYMSAYLHMVSIAFHAVDPATELHFRIAQHQQYAPRAVEAFWRMKHSMTFDRPAQSNQLKDITPVAPEDTPGVQAADVLAFLWYRLLTRGSEHLSQEERSTCAALWSRPGRLQTASAIELTTMLDMQNPATRAKFAKLRFA